MNVVIAGYGVEGKASYDYWRRQGATVAIADERQELLDTPAGTQLLLGRGVFEQLGAFDVIVRSPGVSPHKLPYGDKVWSATNEFFTQCKAPIIGVTGTKGKGTVSSLIAAILRAAGEKVHLVGNIGKPALEVLPHIRDSDVVVFELSSFQLWDAVKSPYVAVILGIEPDHLEVHTDFSEYVDAKANIVRYQTDLQVTIWNNDNQYARQIAEHTLATRVPYPTAQSAYAEDGYFWLRGEKLCSIAALQLPGMHNIENACAAITASSYFIASGLVDAVEQGLRSFTGLPHRLKFVAEKHGVKYYDDSIATTPGSAIAAMHSFEAPKLLILGGSSKGVGYQEVVATAKSTGTQVLAIGETGPAILQLCEAQGVVASYEPGFMQAVVAHASQLVPVGGVVLLSPASASFDQYNNYADRGDQFIRAVEEL